MKSIAMFRNVIVLAALGASAGLALAGPLSGLTQSTNIGVSASVASNCEVSTVSSGLSFGVYDPTAGSDNTTSTSFKVKCSKNASYTIGLSKGRGVSDTERAMTLSGEKDMDYAIYSDSGRTTNWGATVGAPSGTGSGMNTENEIMIYGRIGKNQYNVGVGAYSDIVVATISY